jgi:GTPase SAR1 family protein
MLEHSAWAIPVARELYKSRAEISGAYAWLKDRFTEGRRIAVTGSPGAGKTVLLDHLTGKAFEPGYKLPGLSTTAERGRIRDDRSKIEALVIPGSGGAWRPTSGVERGL